MGLFAGQPNNFTVPAALPPNMKILSNLFFLATGFNQAINTWNTQNVTIMDNMFEGASTFDQPLTSWNVLKLTTAVRMFADAPIANTPANWPNFASNPNLPTAVTYYTS